MVFFFLSPLFLLTHRPRWELEFTHIIQIPKFLPGPGSCCSSCLYLEIPNSTFSFLPSLQNPSHPNHHHFNSIKLHPKTIKKKIWIMQILNVLFLAWKFLFWRGEIKTLSDTLLIQMPFTRGVWIKGRPRSLLGNVIFRILMFTKNPH